MKNQPFDIEATLGEPIMQAQLMVKECENLKRKLKQSKQQQQEWNKLYLTVRATLAMKDKDIYDLKMDLDELKEKYNALENVYNYEKEKTERWADEDAKAGVQSDIIKLTLCRLILPDGYNIEEMGQH